MPVRAERGNMSDLSAEVNQTTCDKLLASVKYPLTVVERRESFPGCDRVKTLDDGDFYRYSDEEVDEMFAECVKFVRTDTTRTEETFYDQLYAFGGTVIQQAKTILDASDESDYEGPSKEELTSIIDGGIENLGKTLRGFLGDWGVYAWNSYLKVVLKEKPTLKLESPRTDLDNVRIDVRATGELWAKYPWYNCHRWCTKWKKVIKCDKIASLTVGVDIKADAHADIAASGTKVLARAKFDKLRLDYPILKEIPLEGIANGALSSKFVEVYDASKLIATVPVLGSSFAVDTIALPAKNDGVRVEVTIKQI
jgi:hypothetical protein